MFGIARGGETCSLSVRLGALAEFSGSAVRSAFCGDVMIKSFLLKRKRELVAEQERQSAAVDGGAARSIHADGAASSSSAGRRPVNEDSYWIAALKHAARV